jgi:hypothetical protein
MDVAELNSRLKEKRLENSARVRGGWPVPLAGATYWVVLAYLGDHVSPQDWSWIAAMMSGAMLPLALAYAALLREGFLKEKHPEQGVTFMAMAGMVMVWPCAILATATNNALVPHDPCDRHADALAGVQLVLWPPGPVPCSHAGPRGACSVDLGPPAGGEVHPPAPFGGRHLHCHGRRALCR